MGTGPPGVGVLHMSSGPLVTAVWPDATLAQSFVWLMSGIAAPSPGPRRPARARIPDRATGCQRFAAGFFAAFFAAGFAPPFGAFAQGNQTQFNRLDGAGYDFVAEHVLALDPANPQMAARILQAFRSWRALEPLRRARAEAALRRVASAPNLSRDASDIAQRSLAET